MGKVELLAPAGNMEAFYGAINAGADAVYLAGKKFGARAYADNFSEEEIISILEYAHLFKKKIYLTVNTLLKENEVEELTDYITPLYNAGLDGVIVQDMGVMKLFAEVFPDMEIHASTQTTITGPNSASLFKRIGVTRVVPARELSIKEIKEIKNATGLEIESFIHGAMCYSYSGQCLFSSILGGRSGNRGRCAGPCRLPYSFDDKKAGSSYPLSMKDMCSITILPDIIKAGANSLKIEGRMKKPEYVAGVTSIYRKYLDLFESGAEYSVKKEDLDFLSKLYMRCELSTGYYKERNGRDMITLDSPAYIATDDRIINRIKEQYIEKPEKLPINISCEMIVGKPVCVTASYDSCEVRVTGMIVETAKTVPMSSEKIAEKLGKLGDTHFCAERINVSTDDNSFVPVGEINSLRRDCLALLLRKVLEKNGYGKRNIGISSLTREENIRKANNITIKLNTFDQFKALIYYLNKDEFVGNKRVTRLYLDAKILFNDYFNISLIPSDIEVMLSTSQIVRLDDKEYINKCIDAANKYNLSGILVSSQEMFGALSTYEGKIILDENMYCFNSYAADMYMELGVNGITMPLELNYKEIRDLEERIPAELSVERTVYGYIPMMVSANCVNKTQGKCYKGANQNSRVSTIKDRNNTKFTVFSDCERCLNIIYNSVPTYIDTNKYSLFRCDYRYNFTIEDYDETLKILDGKIPSEHTGGHNQRGVE